MTELFFSLSMNLVAYWILLLLMQDICNAKMNLNRKNVLTGTGISMAFTVVFMLIPNDSLGILSLISMFSSIIVSTLLFSHRKLIDCLLLIPSMALYVILGIFPNMILTTIFPLIRSIYTIPNTQSTISDILTDLILLALLVVIHMILSRIQIPLRLNLKEILGCVGLFFFSVILVAFIKIINLNQLSPTLYACWMVIFIGAFLFVVGYFLYSILESRIKIYREINALNEKRFMQMKLESLQDVKENEESVRRMRHDLTNHLAIIQGLCDEGNYNEVKKYTGRLRHDVSLPGTMTQSGTSILSGNSIADLILRNKMKLCEEKNIKFDFDGLLDRLIDMDAPDLCGLLANAYDNAIEASETTEDAWIRTKIHTTRNFVVIQITNPIANEVTIRNGKLSTTKKDKSSHGYGTEIMKRVALKYHGNCTFSGTKEDFTVKITLPTA